MARIEFVFQTKEGTTLGQIDKFTKKYFPGFRDEAEAGILEGCGEISIGDIKCPICGCDCAEYGCFDGDVTGYCPECGAHFNEIDECESGPVGGFGCPCEEFGKTCLLLKKKQEAEATKSKTET